MSTSHRTIYRRGAREAGASDIAFGRPHVTLSAANRAGLDTWSTTLWIANALLEIFAAADEVEVLLEDPLAGHLEHGIRLRRDGTSCPTTEPRWRDQEDDLWLLRIREGDSNGPVIETEHTMTGAICHGGRREATIAVRASTPGTRFDHADLDLLAQLGSELGAMLRMARLHDAFLRRTDLCNELSAGDGAGPRRLPLIDGIKFLVERRVGAGRSADFYDVSWVAPHRLAISVGSVTGGSVRAALLAPCVASGLRLAAMADPDSSPDQLLAAISDDLDGAGLGGHRIKCVLFLLDIRTSEALYANTSDHTPLVWRHSTGGLQRVKQPLEERRAERTMGSISSRRIRFAPGDSLMLHTSGVVDALDVQGQAFGVERLERSVSGVGPLRLSEFVARAMSALRRHIGGTAPVDDMTLFGIVVAPNASLGRPPTHPRDLEERPSVAVR